ncbi:hypothetical protein ROS62_17490 [Streptomyces sp. DSM 41972]|uniref:Uncharacterized protein n=1 Tax=Streptomyces althioticus subsp. attaecolombicae TaxID=3075534 RepID=A0ABU3I0W8_9ACTN|nr:hypothetical protein [Streptomyces sp. DSM 41972]SCD98521.1 hypothetical protein GA0115238_140236 [Streptomyces sp. di50b]SCE28214.1 hypothetical protein GA0115245_128636 [Streptomyces sp. di188]
MRALIPVGLDEGAQPCLPDEEGRDIQAGTAAGRIAGILGRVETGVGRRS